MNQSSLFGVSIRGWLAILFGGTVCALAVMQMTIPDALNNLAIAAVSFYFGQRNNSSKPDEKATPPPVPPVPPVPAPAPAERV